MDDVLERLRARLAGRYAILKEIGAGGMATVYLADDLKHHRKVAVKLLRPDLAAILGGTRFLREIEIAAQLSHPHILPLHDSGDADGLLYYVMPLVEGESLRTRIERDGALPVSDAVRLLRDIVDALAYAHAHHVLHRDIKPDNVMLAGRHALVTDFGVAKAVSEAGAGAALTTVGVSLGTPAYMAPEQATADPALDHRADLYAVGVLAYEMLTGHLPFSGPTAQAIMAAHITARPRPLVQERPDVPPALARLVMRCLEKRADDRFATTDELLAELEKLTTPSGGTTPIAAASARALATPGRRALAGTLAAVLLIGVVGLSVAGWHRHTRKQWVALTGLPQMRTLLDSGQTLEAWNVATQVRAVSPGDSALASLLPRMSRFVSIRSAPAGARVRRRAVAGGDTSWVDLGVTPLDSVLYPNGSSLLRFEKEGYRPLVVLTTGAQALPLVALDNGRGAQAGMVRVPDGQVAELNLPGLEHLGGYYLDSFRIDQYEVTNRQFKAFVDSGGYRRREWWAEPFVDGGRTLGWEEAVRRFTDRTGRPGPATWEAGDFPGGQADYPVAGVSWYEAAAYARFAGKSLPTIHHWVRAAVPQTAAAVVPRSNLNGRAAAPVGTFGGVGRYGTLDMAGNVREWCLNADAERPGAARYILGGGWSDPAYAFNDPYTQPPFDRSAINGIRLVSHVAADTTLARASRPAVRAFRDFAHERPVNASIYAVYRRMYDYDPAALNARIEQTDSSAENWIWQRVSYDAPYGHERAQVYLYLPRNGRPPYQTVILFPGSGALNLRTFDPVAQISTLDFVLRSGRAVLYPIYKSTFERGDGFEKDVAEESGIYRDHAIMWVKDFRRAVDYVATRPDLDSTRVGYFGVSWGGVYGGIVPAVERRVRTVVLMVAGLEMQRAQPEVEPINFLPHITQPVLMLNGQFDYYFPVETSQKPFFRLLGTPPEQKRYVIHESGHFVPRTRLIAETLAWYDRYLGPVN